ncbi:hypothetical protein U1Q18_020426, partial [Sarracenia purpurea var. burkii]
AHNAVKRRRRYGRLEQALVVDGARCTMVVMHRIDRGGVEALEATSVCAGVGY